ncbi:MAG: putative CAMKK/META protein kinase [Streblomastix strix]|uniref:Putative CAMKK/META protein kinase n=1 Tax=Streblomastix strix TaxID=222440 RepID=A0A5J4VL36_9EUKA|nr:MAG: putative CAMKK/META protein kinase [Streblomastix strix]
MIRQSLSAASFNSVASAESTQSVIETKNAKKEIDELSGKKTLNQYVILKKLGQGSFAKVKLVHVQGYPDELYAMKVVKKDLKKKMVGPPRRGPAGAVPAKNLPEILEFVKGGSCYEEGQTPMNEDEARNCFRDVIVGISYMHKNNIVHHDIKPDNLLRNENGNVKISDFGVSAYYDDMTTRIKDVRGTPAFIPPEAVIIPPLPEGYLPSLADVYALGASLFMFIYGHTPYMADTPFLVYQQAINKPLPFDTDENKDITSKISPELRNLLEGTLEKDPTKRITIETIRQHPWLTCNGTLPLPDELEAVRVTESDLETAFTPVIPFATLNLEQEQKKQDKKNG